MITHQAGWFLTSVVFWHVDQRHHAREILNEIHSQAVATVFISTVEGAPMPGRLYNERQYITFARRHIKQNFENSLRR